MTRFDVARRKMAEQQLTDIADARVRAALHSVPRELFVPSALQHRAYDDGPLPIAERQTISQPWIVARMTELLEPKATDRVLEIGTGSGYQAAVLSGLVSRVVSVERHGSLARDARKRLEKLGYHNVTVLHGDGTMGRSELAPFDWILVTAAAPHVPKPLIKQLAPGGPLLVPVGERDIQQIIRIRTDAETGEPLEPEAFEGCRFVPLLGRFGWKEGT